MNLLGSLISLSLVLHICIILFKKMRIRLPSFMTRKRKRRKVPRPAKKYFSAAIMMTVAIIIFACVGLIINSSVVDPHSNIKMIGALVESFHPQSQAMVAKEESGSVKVLVVTPVDPCAGSRASSLDENSLVDQLVARNMPHDFDFRASLARKYHIPNYLGRTAQNMLLVQKLEHSSPLPKDPCKK